MSLISSFQTCAKFHNHKSSPYLNLPKNWFYSKLLEIYQELEMGQFCFVQLKKMTRDNQTESSLIVIIFSLFVWEQLFLQICTWLFKLVCCWWWFFYGTLCSKELVHGNLTMTRQNSFSRDSCGRLTQDLLL